MSVIKSAISDGRHSIISSQRTNGIYSAERKNRYVRLHSDPKAPENDDIYNVEKLFNLFKENIPNDFSGDVTFFNAVGGAHVTKWKNETEYESLERFNVRTAECFTKAVNRLVGESSFHSSRLVQCSSIMGQILPKDNGYGQAKLASEEIFKENHSLNSNIDHVLIIRIGYAVQDLLSERNVGKAHDFSPEQIAYQLPCQPIILGCDKAKIYPVHIDDIVTAVLNPIQNHKFEIVNAVGDKGYDLSDFFKHYCKTLGQKFIPVEISLDEFSKISKSFPHGHIAEYSSSYLSSKNTQLCNHSFKNLISKKDGELLGLDDVQSRFMLSNLEVNELGILNPIPSFIGTVTKKVIKEPHNAKNISILFTIGIRAIKSILKHKFNVIRYPYK
jgi:hypothetical protein